MAEQEFAHRDIDSLANALQPYAAKASVETVHVALPPIGNEPTFKRVSALQNFEKAVSFGHSNVNEQAEAVKEAVTSTTLDEIKQLISATEARFSGEKRKANLAHRSSALNALGLDVPFKQRDVVAQAAAVQTAAGKASKTSVNEALSALATRARQSMAMFKPAAPTGKDKEFAGSARKNNIRANIEAPDLGALSDSARARLEKMDVKTAPTLRKH